MIINCPLTMGKKNKVKCIDGNCNGEFRCPYYQDVVNEVSISRILDLEWIHVATIGRFYNDLQSDFTTIGQYMKSCIYFPGINEKNITIKLLHNDGSYWDVEKVLNYYTNDRFKEKIEQQEIINNDEGKTEQQMCYQ